MVDPKLYAKGFCNAYADKLRRQWSPSTCLSCSIGFEKVLGNPLKAQTEPTTHRTRTVPIYPFRERYPYVDRADNERLTDVAMFVLGMGNLFLNGFRSKNVDIRQRGHRMGYLTDEEYNFLSGEVIRLRTTALILQLPSETQLRGWLLNRLSGNKPMLERSLAQLPQFDPKSTFGSAP